MEPNRPKALLIGESPQGSLYLTKRLQESGCECAFAVTCREACSLLTAHDFDLVLSPMRLRDGSLYPLIGLLGGSSISLFYYHPVEDGCLWLPALRRGQKCFGSSALRPSEFVAALDETTKEIRAMQRKVEQCVAPELSRSVAMLVSSRGELPPNAPDCGKDSELLGCNAVG
jgi:CheY-like chemotaxis protein